MRSTSDLRDLANTYGRYDVTGVALGEAADEIDRLRARLRDCQRVVLRVIDPNRFSKVDIDSTEVSDELG
jgi:hypothetical protein